MNGHSPGPHGPGQAVAPPRAAAAVAQAAASSAPAGSCEKNAPKPPAGARQVAVATVVDGDTVELQGGERVRLIGMNTPESVDPGKQALMQLGQTPRDRYGRALAWLWLTDGRFVNGHLVHQGYAQVFTFPDNPAPASPPAESGVVITRAPGTARPGSTATVSARAPPGSSCSIVVRHKSGPSTAAGLLAKQAMRDGSVSWTWNIGTRTTPGTWPVTITCGGKSAGTSVTVQ